MKTIFKEEEMTNKIADNLMDGLMPTKIPEGEVGLTFDGKIAIRRKNGDFVVYNAESKTIQNQMNCVIKSAAISRLMLLVPTTALQAGDIIKEKESYYYVLSGTNAATGNDKKIKVVNLSTGNINNLNQEENILTGCKAYKKVTSFMTSMQDMSGNPMLPFLLMSEDSNDSSLLKTMMMAQMMSGNTANAFGNINPMMFACMDGDSDLLPLLMMNGLNFGGVTNTAAE